MPMDVETYQSLGLDQPTPEEVNDRSNYDIRWAIDHPDDDYAPCAEADPAPEVAPAHYEKIRDWQAPTASRYAGTVRDIGFALPASGDLQDLNLLICQDGAGYSSRSGPVRATQVLDTLQHRGDIPPTGAIFVNPGRPADAQPASLTPAYDAVAIQRSIEYDTLTPVYGEFLLDEIIPLIEQRSGARFTRDPARRMVCGMSSGGICAFSVAWFHSDAFARVLSHCGSFTNIRGGHNYPYLVRTTPRKDLRVWLQSGAQDAQTLFGDWPTANMAMARALEYAGYASHFDYGRGGHTLRHAGASFADAIRWLWSDGA